MRRSRTQPPTNSARPPASRAAAAICSACWSESDTAGLPAELLDHPVGKARRDGVENHEHARLLVRVDLRDRMLDPARDGFGHFVDRLLRPERAGHVAAALALQDVDELNRHQDRAEDADVD